MSIARIAFSVLTTFVILCGVASAQDAAVAQAQASSGAIVTAAGSASGVRFVSPGEARRIRLEVYTASGERLFDSDFRAGGILDWDGAGLTDGSYLCVVTVEDLQGKTARRLSAVSIRSGRASVRKDEEEALKTEYAQALAAAGETQADASAAAAPKKTQAVTVTAHDGRDGQVTSTAGALTFRTGDVFSGKDKEQVRITPEGQVGIGTDKPEAALDVAGTIRARGGIQFGDGTVVTSAAQLAAVAGTAAFAKSAQQQPSVGAATSGTPNRLIKWADASGTTTDSAITETSGLTVFGQANPLFPSAPNFHVVEVVAQGTKTPLTLVGGSGSMEFWKDASASGLPSRAVAFGMATPGATTTQDAVFSAFNGSSWFERMRLTNSGNLGLGTGAPSERLEVAGNIKLTGADSGIKFSDGTVMTTASGGGSMTGTSIVSAINDPATSGLIGENRLSPNVARLNGANIWSGANLFGAGLSANGAQVTNVGNPVAATDAVNKSYVDANAVRFNPAAAQVSVGDANGTAAMLSLEGGSTCCSGPGGYTAADFKIFQNGSFVATGNLGIGVSPMEGKGYRTSWYTYKGAFRSGYADNEWDDANTGFFSWAGGSNTTASGLYAFAFGDTNQAESTSSIVFGSGNEVKGAAGFSAGAGNRVCDTYGVAFGDKAISGGPLVNGRCDPDSFNIHGLAAVAMGFNVTADQDFTMAFGKFASNNGFTGTFVWSDGSATASADTFKNTANNEFAARATGGFRFRTNLAGTTGCNLPAGSGVFNCTSSRTTKENFSMVSGDDVLARLRKVPVSTWNYISEGRATRHLGPMAEDFYAAFQIGVGNTSIGVQDAVGVSLAAVKALDARTLELQKKTEEVEQLRAKVNSLEQRLAALEQLIESNTKQAGASQK